MLCVIAKLDKSATERLSSLKKAFVPAEFAARPLYGHITIANYIGSDEAGFIRYCKAMLEGAVAFQVEYKKLEVLKKSAIIVASPEKAGTLAALHREIAEKFAPSLNDWTQPELWQPHTTLLYSPALDLDAICANMKKAFAPFSARVCAIEFSRVLDTDYEIVERVELKEKAVIEGINDKDARMTRVFFVRHAEPNYANHDDMLRELSPKGMADRALVTRFLEDKDISAVLSSPYKRAVDTVADFAEKHGFEIEIDFDFRERKVSDGWINNFTEFSEKQWADHDYSLPNGESLNEVQKRSIAALERALTKYAGKSIVIGSHGTALSTIINHYDNCFGYKDFERIRGIMPWIVEFEFDEKENCLKITEHEVGMNDIIIRHETEKDYRAVEELMREAFWNVYKPGADEHYYVHMMRSHPDFLPELDFVLEKDGRIVGSIMFTKAWLEDERGERMEIVSCGPLCIAPELQRQKLGKMLIEHSFEAARKLGYGVNVNFGNPGNYVSRGFVSCKKKNISFVFDGNFPTALLVCELKEGALDGRKRIYIPSTAADCCEDTAAVEAFDATFPPKEKKWMPSQEEFYIYRHSSVVR